ncbi:hypothetical protein BX600DRAFT_461297 [Xylariales sp. PMI_506]|nr:hypothetical protein BX600DRAFT_461297 [Xylariales sp. PMI_506]
MELPDGAPARPRRRRTERGPRSKQGCRTCISKKVKCDEQHPDCGRCTRLSLQCTWEEQRPTPLANRRRGLGPIKDRTSWTPPLILAKPSSECRDFGLATVIPGPSTASSPPDGDTSSVERVLEIGSRISDGETDESSPSSVGFGEFATSPASTHANSELELVSPRPTDVSTGLAASINSQAHMAIRNSVCVPVQPWRESITLYNLSTSATSLRLAGLPITSAGSSDSKAVVFFRAVFAPLKSTRTAGISAHSIFLNRALESSMALHFLLAVSHSELAIHQGQGVQTPHESWLHFDRGSQLFFRAPNISSTPDHIGTMLSFLYMYMFWMRRDPYNHSILRELSGSVLMYIKTFELDELCTSEPITSTNESNNCSRQGAAYAADHALLSRILTYLYDRDGFCYFFGCGGALASYVNSNLAAWHNVWRRSRVTLPGADNVIAANNSRAPLNSGDAKITAVYFHLIAIHQDINCYSQETADEALGRLETRIRRNLEQVENDHRFLFEEVADCKRSGSPPSLMALVTATFFFALQIYFYRSRNSAFGECPVPTRIQNALSNLVAMAYYTVATGPVQLMERFQWAMLIGGTETHDPVHREWILNNMADPAMNGTLRLILDAKKKHKAAAGGTISMHELRRLVSGVNLSTQGNCLSVDIST